MVRPARAPGRKKAQRARAPRGTATPDATRHSIRVASLLTGIELDTLRMWERRYGFPKPERSEGGSRVYSDVDVEALKLIQRTLELGYRPGEVVGKSREELRALLDVVSSRRAPTSDGSMPGIASLLAAITREDLSVLQAELRQSAIVLGPKRFVTEIAHPLAVRVGEKWADGELEVRHEHALSEALSSQLRLLTSSFDERAGAPRVLLSTLPDERHGLGLEMVGLYLSVSQITPRLLGVDTPAPQIVRAARAMDVDAVGLLVTGASDARRTASRVRWMLRELPRRVRIWVGGAGGRDLGVTDEAVRLVGAWSDLDLAIEALKSGASASRA